MNKPRLGGWDTVTTTHVCKGLRNIILYNKNFDYKVNKARIHEKFNLKMGKETITQEVSLN